MLFLTLTLTLASYLQDGGINVKGSHNRRSILSEGASRSTRRQSSNKIYCSTTTDCSETNHGFC